MQSRRTCLAVVVMSEAAQGAVGQAVEEGVHRSGSGRDPSAVPDSRGIILIIQGMMHCGPIRACFFLPSQQLSSSKAAPLALNTAELAPR